MGILFVLGFSLISVLIIFFVCYFIAKITLLLSGLAVVFSRISFSLLIALSLSQSHQLVAHSWGNFFIWFAIAGGGIFLITRMPRVDYAMEFLTASAISCLVSKLLLMLLLNSILPTFGIHFDYNTVIDVILTVICIGYAAFSVKQKIEMRYAENTPRALPLPLTILERLLAALIYGLSVLLLCALSNLFSGDVFVQWIILIGGSVAGLLFDLLIINHLI